MRKLMVVLAFICGIIAFFAYALFSNSWKTVQVVRSDIHSELYAKQEVAAAMDAVEQGFAQDLKDARLTEISYDEQASSTYADSFKKHASDEVIVVFTDFITVFHLFPSEEQLLEPNTTYKGYPWVLRRSANQKAWEIIGSGYGYLYT